MLGRRRNHPGFVMLETMAPGESNLPEQPACGLAADIRADALDILADAGQWRLAAQRWQVIEEILGVMDAALAAGDTAAFTAAAADLELVGPLRIIPIGPPPVGPTPKSRDLLNKLVYSLDGIVLGEADDDEPGDNAAGNGAG